MKLEKLKVVVRKLNTLLDKPDMVADFSQQFDQLLAEFDDARRSKTERFMTTSYKRIIREKECP